ncbi:aspartic peptidase domain-containing protein [Cantharellus anzutake]|uniref:aspartic peptidase domain-containing protein n=1 Tax=Cantharellus anzutake TaxID=1750568 RepID=UPI00190767CD|nr:aspartic peptidase domain-containing protein [Cantharellus anzutake]KAF8329360.1 aspartic peptidase domain-containing protein [Cantharellus anzutake]
MTLSWLSALLMTLCLCDAATSSPASHSPREPVNGVSMPLQRRDRPRTGPKSIEYAREAGIRLNMKYGGSPVDKRSTGINKLINQGSDSSYAGSIAVGTPAKSYDVILDTGSADLWLASTLCNSASCTSVPRFDPTNSSSSKNLSQPFSIVYGSGSVAGSLYQDTVQMAGFSVPKQTFALATAISSGIVNAPVSGILGLAYKGLASSGATPFWQALVEGGAWDQPLMTFTLTRFNNASKISELEPGGVFTMGFVNSSLYTGSIEYTNLVGGGTPGFWLIPMTGITVQGTQTLSSTVSVAIDTGTTLIGGPADEIAAIYAQIPGSSQSTDPNLQGFWQYPCTTKISVSIQFGGGKQWPISPADFQFVQNQGVCYGAFFETASTNPSWIIGDSFLKNVMSVYRYNPSSVGFATLSSTAQALANGPVPSPTIGSSPVTPSGAGTSRVGNSPLSSVAAVVAFTVLTSFAGSLFV